MIRSSVVAILLCSLVPPASADVRKPNKIFRVDSSMADIREPGTHTSNIIYLNRCKGGCSIRGAWPDDSRLNYSSIVAGTMGQGAVANISEFAHGDTAWNAVVACVRGAYEPFGIVITEEDPGDQPHFEAIVAGVDNEINYEAGGVAPGGCGITNNAITFSFANQTNSIDVMCWTVAQETAHAFGLDHELLCQDPMTYLTDCGVAKNQFQDENADCGEDTPRGCYCGGSTQNSFRRLMDHFGPGEATPPTVEFRRPQPDKIVKQNFPIEVAPADDVSVKRVEISVNGTLIETLTASPWVINAPGGLDGRVRIEARAYDNLDSASDTASVSVVMEGTLAPFGDDCTENADCETNICAMDGSGGTCVSSCDLETPDCPEGSSCVSAGDVSVCWPDSGDGGEDGGCQTGGGSGAGLASLLLALFFVRRRR
jgi:MYXO-CTERM domain-containing protein